jgi:hypothetical protein
MAKKTEHKVNQSMRDAKLSPTPVHPLVVAAALEAAKASKASREAEIKKAKEQHDYAVFRQKGTARKVATPKRPRPNRHRRGGASVGGLA